MLPVEVVRDEVGTIVAARFTFTTDVDELELNSQGAWTKRTMLVIESGICLAADP